MRLFLILLLFSSLPAFAQKIAPKEVAFTFDDVPFPSTLHFESNERTDALVGKLTSLKLPRAVIFANPCKGKDTASTLRQIAKYRDAGHWIGNHTCSHPRFDDIGFDAFSADAARADTLLKELFPAKKLFRFPMLNEGSDPKSRDQMRAWLTAHGYRNGMVSADNEDQFFSAQINLAKKQGKKIPFDKVKELFIEHLVTSLECDDKLAIETIGRSPKHVMLLHERDVTVMFLGELVAEIRKRGWKIIGADEAFEDPMYLESPKNTFAGYGIVSQLAFEKTGEKKICYDFAAEKKRLNAVLGITK